MKKMANRILAVVILFCTLSFPGLCVDLVPVGQVIGLQLSDGSVTVAAFDDASESPAKNAGLMVGDIIVSIDGKSIHNAEDIRDALKRSGGQIKMTVQRKTATHTFQIEPQITAQGPRLGVYLSQGITGIGTVTWFDPQTGAFGTLGHAVHDGSGNLLQLENGIAYQAAVASVKAGICGTPGQLRGRVDGSKSIGTLGRNTPQGVFGKATQRWQGQSIPASSKNVHTGSATVRCTVTGSNVQEYSVEILKIYPKANSTGRNMLIRITDPELLRITGGIVQGMSGSPIIQNGKLVGAVTHVLVNDPTTGYGIFIENMLDAAG